MLKEHALSMLVNGLPLLLLFIAIIAAMKAFAWLRDFYWVAAALASFGACLGAVAYQAQRLIDNDPANDVVDITYVTYAIVPLFAWGAWINVANTYRFVREHNQLTTSGDTATLRRLRQLRGWPGVGPEEARSRVEEELLDREAQTRLILPMLPSLGLLGTVLGMSLAMGDLGGAMLAVGDKEAGGNEALMAAMQGAFGGLGGAFLTTLVGLIGSLLLTVQTTRTARLVGLLVAAVEERLANEPTAPSQPSPTETPAPKTTRRRSHQPLSNEASNGDIQLV